MSEPKTTTTSSATGSNRLARGISWFLVTLTVLAVVATVALQAMGCRVLVDPAQAEPALAYGLLMLPLNTLAFAVLGALINTYRPENRFGWLATVFGFAMSWAVFADSYGLCGFEARASLTGTEYAIWIARLVELFAFLCLALMPWLFPDGRFVSPRWRRLALVGIGLVLLLNPLRAVLAGQLRVDSFGRQWIENPFVLDLAGPARMSTLLGEGTDAIIMLIFMAGNVSLLLRWRRSMGDTRQQIKELAFFFATSGALFLGVEAIGAAFYPAIFNGWFYVIVLLIFWLGLPVAMGFAVFKYRLFDIDIVIRRTLVYAILTALLALVYFGSVTLFTGLFSQVSGQQSALAIVVSTLLIAALFTPLRRRIQNWIDRRFFRKNYDAQQILAQFAVTARDETDINALTAELVRVVDETIQPEHVSVWLKTTRD